MKKNVSTDKTGMKIGILLWGNNVRPANYKKLSLVGKPSLKGPQIPLELSRINKEGRLTLVIDEDAGKPNEVLFAVSKHNTLAKAFEEFLTNEGIGNKRVGVIDLKNKQTSECAANHSTTAMVIVKWAQKNKFDAVIWSGLSRKFKDVIDVKFSPEAALEYVNNLPASQRKLSVDYIRNLPEHIDTPTRTLILDELA